MSPQRPRVTANRGRLATRTINQVVPAPAVSAVAPCSQRRPLLFVIQGPLLGSVFSLQGRETLIGRGVDADVILADEAISRSHARLTVTPEGASLEDLQSQGGTWVNGQPAVGAVALRDGDQLRLGGSTLVKFSMVGAAEEHAMLTLFELTLRDPLTRCYNRRYFERRLHEEFSFARRQGTALSLLLIDIDHFKRVNDRYGHPVGDLVLERVAVSVQNTMRPEDVLARYGGEEFVVIARDISADNAEVLAERIRRHVLALSVSLPGTVIHVSASIGVATMSPDQPYASCEELVVAGDEAMYEAKDGGRNRVCRARYGSRRA